MVLLALFAGLGALLLVIDLVRGAYPSREARQTRAALRSTRTFREGVVGERVKCTGTVALDVEPLRAPLSGHPAAAVCLTTCENGESSFQRVFTAERRLPFSLLTADGERVDIELDASAFADGPAFRAPWYCKHHGISWTREAPPAAYVDFAAECGAAVPTPTLDGPELDHYEFSLPVGQTLSVIGEKVRDAAAGVYREPPRRAALRVREVHAFDEGTIELVARFDLADVAIEVAVTEPWRLVALAALLVTCLVATGAALR